MAGRIVNTESSPLDPARRQFLKTGLVGSLVLGFAATGAALTACSGDSTGRCKDCLWLTDDDQELLTALVPVMLAGALPQSANEKTTAIKQTVTAIDITISHFSPAIRKEIRQLLDLLQFPVTRLLLTGVTSTWTRASTETMESFLSKWQQSRFDLLRSGYAALHDLICGGWYVNPASWPRIGYSGPPEI